MKSILLAQAGQVAHEGAPAFQVVGKTHQTAATPVLNVTTQAVPAGIPASATAPAASSNDAVANSILGSTMSGYFEMLGYLLLILGGVWLLLWLLRRSGVGMFSPQRQTMAIESRLSLGPKKWMVVTRVHGKRLVLGITDHTISLLAELPPVTQESAVGQGRFQEKKQGASPSTAPQSGLALKAQNVLRKKKQSLASAQASAGAEPTDDFEKFYAAAQEQEKKE